jgi:hypothetical protein
MVVVMVVQMVVQALPTEAVAAVVHNKKELAAMVALVQLLSVMQTQMLQPLLLQAHQQLLSVVDTEFMSGLPLEVSHFKRY